MSPVDPTRDDFKNFMTNGPEGEFVMLNLLRYKPDGGRARYQEYVRAAAPAFQRSGGEIIYFGETMDAMVAGAEEWDAVLLVRYPSKAVFAEMLRDEEYQKVTPIRTEALEAAVLQPTVVP